MNPPSKSVVRSRPITMAEVRELLRQDAGKLFAILDAKGQPLVPQLVAQLAERATSLYGGEAEHKNWHSNPYLIRLDEKLLDWIHDNLFGKPWGIFLFTSASMKDVKQHLGDVLTATNEQGEKKFARFYDPTILPDLLRAVDEELTKELFGLVLTYIAGKSDEDLSSYELADKPVGPTSTEH